MSIGKQIQEARKAAGLTQKRLAEKTGLSPVTIQQYEHDRRKPRPAQLMVLAEVLGVDPCALLSPRSDPKSVIVPDPTQMYNPYEEGDYEEEPEEEIEVERKDDGSVIAVPASQVENYMMQQRLLRNEDEVKSESTEQKVEKIEQEDKIRLQVETAYLRHYRRKRWLHLMTQDGVETIYYGGKLNSVLRRLTPESIEAVEAFAEFLRKREAESFFKENAPFSPSE